MQLTVLAGGVGGARFLRGLRTAAPEAQITVVGNTGDDITLFEYVKRNNRETGEALVGVELSSAADLDGLRARMAASGLHVEALEPGSPAYRYLT